MRFAVFFTALASAFAMFRNAPSEMWGLIGIAIIGAFAFFLDRYAK